MEQSPKLEVMAGVRLSKAFKELLRKEAQEEGLTLSQYQAKLLNVGRVALGKENGARVGDEEFIKASQPKYPDVDVAKVLKELKAKGRSLEHITRMLGIKQKLAEQMGGKERSGEAPAPKEKAIEEKPSTPDAEIDEAFLKDFRKEVSAKWPGLDFDRTLRSLDKTIERRPGLRRTEKFVRAYFKAMALQTQ